MVTLTDEQKAFLLHGTRTGKLATVRKDGRPHVAPIWFVLDGDALIFNTGEDTVKGTGIRRDPRIALCVDDETPPFSFLIVEGTAELIDDLDALRLWATRIAARYMGSELAEQYGARNGVPGELLVRVTLTKVIFAKDIAH
ncbi:MAG TPA: PPOX class F420-dependent oxidoreductase [Ktedonobacteraceae bacterium]|nr:PPOX class F420-dependent oxidoreductase [Ktedonobacteraceae bacterium]